VRATLNELSRRRVVRWASAPLGLVLLLAVSVEEVTGEPPALDPRFFEGGGADAVGSGGGQVPFADYDGELLTLSGTLLGDRPGSADLDLWQELPGEGVQRVHLGKIPMAALGPFELRVPVDFGPLQIEVFRDITGDGPSLDDAFGRVEVDVGNEPVAGVELHLDEDALADLDAESLAGMFGGASPIHSDMPPGGEGSDGGGEHVEAVEGAPGGEEHEHIEVAVGDGTGEVHEHVEAPVGAPGGEEPDDGTGEFEHVEAPEGAPGGEVPADGTGEHQHLEAPEGAPGGGEVEHVEMPPGGEGGGDHQPVEHKEAPAGAPGGEAHQHAEAEPGAPGGEGGAQAEGPPAPVGSGGDPFSGVDGPRVSVKGVVHYTDASAVLDMDVFKDDPDGPGGRAFVGKTKLAPGAFELSVPKQFGAITLEIFLDATGDGPSADDPFVSCPCNPVFLGAGAVEGIEIRLE
jgi:hypothetical protein